MIHAAALAVLVLAGPGSRIAQEPVGGERACCAGHEADAAGHAAGCRHAAAPELAPLSEDATDKERWLRRIHDTVEDREHLFLSRGAIEVFRERRDEAEAGSDPRTRMAGRLGYGSVLMSHGRLEEAIAELEGCVALLDEHPDAFRAWDRPEALRTLALAWFRLAERRNCIAHHNADSCIFPLRGGAVHVEREGAARTAEIVLEILEADPDDHEARWMLNVALMALGTWALDSWPEGVPEEHRYPAERFASEAPFARFVDVAARHGLDRFDRAGSVVLDDLTGDGRIDVLTCSFDTGTPLSLMAGVEGGGFRDVTAEAGLAHQLGGSGLVQGDVDGDGLLDVLVLRGGDLFVAGEMPCSLLRQVRPGRFVDVTAEAGIEIAGPSRSAAFADVDGDGDLDLFVGYQSLRNEGSVRYPSILWRNDGGGRFEDVTEAAGIHTEGHCMAVAFGDVDGDGYPDLYVSNHFTPNQLFANRGDGTFEDVTEAAGVAEPLTGSSALFFDYDNDGDLDLFAAHHGHAVAERAVAHWYWDGTVEAGTARLYENDGAGIFRDVTAERGLERVAYATAAAAGDLDGDGWPDLYLATGAAGMAALWPNVAYRNDGGKRFQDVTEAAGLGHLQKGQGVALADVGEDGDLDVFVQVGGHQLDDGFGNVLFENPGSGNRFLTVDLVGGRANRFGVGARLRVRVRDANGEERDVFAFVGAAGPNGGSSPRQVVGLGRAEEVLALEVRWPGENGTQRVEDLVLDAHAVVTEAR